MTGPIDNKMTNSNSFHFASAFTANHNIPENAQPVS